MVRLNSADQAGAHTIVSRCTIVSLVGRALTLAPEVLMALRVDSFVPTPTPEGNGYHSRPSERVYG